MSDSVFSARVLSLLEEPLASTNEPIKMHIYMHVYYI